MHSRSDLIISQSDGRPLYLQIVEQIRQRVAVRDWQKGHEIPSIRQLAMALRVSVITVKRAYLELEREGIIVTQHGKGSVVAADADLHSELNERELSRHLEQVVRLGSLLSLSPADLIQRLQTVLEKKTADRMVEEQK